MKNEEIHVVCHQSDSPFWDEVKVHLGLLPRLKTHVAVILASAQALADSDWRAKVQDALDKQYPPYILYVSEAAYKLCEFFTTKDGKKTKRVLLDYKPVNEHDKPLRLMTLPQRDRIYSELTSTLYNLRS